MTPLSFEDYCRTIREADVQFILTRPATGPWWLYFVQTDVLSIQFGGDGGASIADGAISNANYVLMGRHGSLDTEILFNGELLNPHDFVLLPPGSRFIFAGSAARAWYALTIPPSSFEAICSRQLARQIPTRSATVLPVSPQLHHQMTSQCEGLRDLIRKAVTAPETLPAVIPLIENIRTILSDGQPGPRVPAEKFRTFEMVYSALDALRQSDSFEPVYVEKLAVAANVHPRTLLRAFHSVVRMGPVRYLRLRQLNNLRRQLYDTKELHTVTEAMQAVGANDMGRLSGAYRALFGETPSETLRARRRAVTV